MNEIESRMFAAELDALVSSAGDPLTRFIASVQSSELRNYVEETVRLRDELISNTQRMLVASNAAEVGNYASLIAKNSYEVGYRWLELRRSLERWTALQIQPVWMRASK